MGSVFARSMFLANILVASPMSHLPTIHRMIAPTIIPPTSTATSMALSIQPCIDA